MNHLIFASVIIIYLLAVFNRVIKIDKKTALFVCFLILFIFAAIRYGYGNDYFSYMSAFEGVHNGTYSFGDEILFEKFVEITPSFYLFIAVTTLITIYPIYKLIYKYVDEKYAWIALFIYCFNPYLFLISLSSIRQFVAVSLFIVATSFAYKRKVVPYILTVIAASLVHTSAVVLFPMYFIANDKKLTKKTIFIIMGIVAMLLMNADAFNNLITNSLDLIDKANYEYYFITGSGSSLRSVILSFVFLIYIAINIPKLTGPTLMCAKIYFIGTIIGVLVYHVNMMGRLQFYFDVFSVVAIPMIFKLNISQKKSKFINIINKLVIPSMMLAIYAGRYMNFFNAPLWESFTEYKTIFEVLI